MIRAVILTALGVLMGGYLLYQLGVGELIGGAGNALTGSACKKTQPMASVLALAEIYPLSEALAKAWKADAVLVRLDNTLTAPLQPNGNSTDWNVSFYSAAAKGGMQIHTGDGKLFCSTYRGEPAGYIPALRPDFTRDGAALYMLAEKHGQALLGKGYGVMINLWTYSETHHAMWHVTYVKRDGSDSGMRLVVDANTGALEEIEKH